VKKGERGGKERVEGREWGGRGEAPIVSKEFSNSLSFSFSGRNPHPHSHSHLSGPGVKASANVAETSPREGPNASVVGLYDFLVIFGGQPGLPSNCGPPGRPVISRPRVRTVQALQTSGPETPTSTPRLTVTWAGSCICPTCVAQRKEREIV
jgi:hypothetical protein